ncbi:MAG: hypothetical protein J6R47_01075 [Acholeplasmatales bacterium]|nr:hypothetical protein [Acholeplasmatales bacterium]
MIDLNKIRNLHEEDIELAKTSFDGCKFICTPKLLDMIADTFDIYLEKSYSENKEVVALDLEKDLNKYLDNIKCINKISPNIKAEQKIAQIIKAISMVNYIVGGES